MLENTQWQISKFAIIGIAATLTHVAIYALLYSQYNIYAQLANIIAWGFALVVSYTGQKHWTFKEQKHPKHEKLRFIICSLLSLVINAGFAHLFSTVYEQWLLSVLCMFFITPALTFILMKFWVFADAE